MDLKGKIILITGATAGIGLASAKKLALQAATVIMIGRDPNRAIAARSEVAKVSRGPAPTLFTADFSSQEDIYTLVNSLYRCVPRIDVLINNAGSIFAKRELTKDGVEKTLATNHVAPFYLTSLLLDLVKESPEGRILTVASESHSGTMDFDNLQGEKKYNFFDAYNRSKLCNILFSYELSRRLKGSSVTSNCISPGPTQTTFGNSLTGLPGLFPLIIKNIPFLLKSPEQSAENYVYAATSSDLKGVSGKFFFKGREWKTKQITYNDQVASRLWTITESLIKPGNRLQTSLLLNNAS